MRTAALMFLLGASGWAGGAFGTWMMNPARSVLASYPRPKSITIRIESHAKGEVFTLDRIEADGRATTSSTLLYLDGKARDFLDAGCSGTQSSQRVDIRTVEILRSCEAGAWMRVIWRVNTNGELTLEVNGRRPDGRQVQMLLVLQKQ